MVLVKERQVICRLVADSKQASIGEVNVEENGLTVLVVCSDGIQVSIISESLVFPTLPY